MTHSLPWGCCCSCWKSSPMFTGVETEDQTGPGVWGSTVSLFRALPTLGQAAEEASQNHS